jgi:hypothetical protein
MANETLYTTVADQRTAEVIAGIIMQLRADRTALINHPALIKAGSINGKNSNVLKVPRVGLNGYDLPASATDDGSATSYTALADGYGTVTVTPFRKAYAPSDLARVTDGNGVITPEQFAQDAFLSVQHKLTDMIANLVDGFTAFVGTSGQDATVAEHLEAKATLTGANVPGPYIAVYHTRQWADMLEDLYLNAGGAAQWEPATPELVAKLGTGYQGMLAGVHVFTTNRVPTANGGADRAGGMFGPGAIAWGDGLPIVDDPNTQVLLDSVMFEMNRVGLNGLTQFITNALLGAAVLDDGCGVSVITDA